MECLRVHPESPERSTRDFAAPPPEQQPLSRPCFRSSALADEERGHSTLSRTSAIRSAGVGLGGRGRRRPRASPWSSPRRRPWAPTALERVANREAESAHALYAHLDGVAVLHRAEVLVVGAQEEYVAGADLLDSRHDRLRQGSGN